MALLREKQQGGKTAGLQFGARRNDAFFEFRALEMERHALILQFPIDDVLQHLSRNPTAEIFEYEISSQRAVIVVVV